MTDIKQSALADRLTGVTMPLTQRTPMPEDAYYAAAIIEYGGVTLVVGGDYEAPCDQWAGQFDVCTVRVEDSATDIYDLFTAAQIKTLESRAYWSIRRDEDALA